MRHSGIATAGTLVLSLLAEPIAAQPGGEARRGAIGSRVSDYGGFVAFDVRFGDMMNEFAIGIGGSYRLVGDVDVPGLRDADLRGFVGLVRLRLGWF